MLLHNRSSFTTLRRVAVGTLFVLAATVASGLPAAAQSQASAPGRTGVNLTVVGHVVTAAELASRAAVPKFAIPRITTPRRVQSHPLTAPLPAVDPSQAIAPVTTDTRKLPQAFAQELLGIEITDTVGYVPPDTMGAVGPTQFLFAANGNFRAFLKSAPFTKIFDVNDTTFWGSTGLANSAGVSDPHVRYDPTSGRWFITEIDTPAGDGHILLAVSSSRDLSTASWTQFALPATGSTSATDAGCFADYDTPGIDQNGIYVGANMFPGTSACPGTNYLHSNLYVIQKSSALTGTVHFTQFFNVATSPANDSLGPTIQGVDSIDPASVGHAIAVNESTYPATGLNVWTINNPGSTSPTLSSPVNVPINAENGTIGTIGVAQGVVSANNAASGDPLRGMDDLDDRLFSATLRNGHLWTAHNVAVNSSGGSNSGTLNRDAVRWYDISMSGSPTLNQSGTVYDNAGSNPLSYWMGTVMVSGQGHVAMGLNRANSTTTVQAGAMGRLAGDAAGTMRGFSVFQFSTNDAYDDAYLYGTGPVNPVNRWGDYTYTSLDPCDDMTLWTAQEFVAGSADTGIDWKTAAEKLLAPPPAVLSGGILDSVARGQTAVYTNLTGSSPNGEGFYDTPNTILDSCRTRLTAAANNGVTVTGVTYVDPQHVTLRLNTTGATSNTAGIMITNPDGQFVTGTIAIAAQPAGRIDTIGIYRSGTFLLRLHNNTGYADLSIGFSSGTKPYPVVGDWAGAGYDQVGVSDQNTGVFKLCTTNTTAGCANGANQITFALGNPNDVPLSGRWYYYASHAGAGVFRPSNGVIYLKNQLTSGFADYNLVLGLPGDDGVAGDWTGKGFDSPGVFRPATITYFGSNQVTDGVVYGDFSFVYGTPSDLPVVGDWIAQGHDGVGLFRSSNGFAYLRNTLTSGYADNSFFYGAAGDLPVAGHWQVTYPPIAPVPVLIPKTPAPAPNGVSVPGDNQIGG